MTEHILDSKRDVDNRLKKVCEQLIYTCSEMIASPLTAFIAKADVILQMNQNEQSIKPIILKNQPFATPEKVSFIFLINFLLMYCYDYLGCSCWPKLDLVFIVLGALTRLA